MWRYEICMVFIFIYVFVLYKAQVIDLSHVWLTSKYAQKQQCYECEYLQTYIFDNHCARSKTSIYSWNHLQKWLKSIFFFIVVIFNLKFNLLEGETCLFSYWLHLILCYRSKVYPCDSRYRTSARHTDCCFRWCHDGSNQAFSAKSKEYLKGFY